MVGQSDWLPMTIATRGATGVPPLKAQRSER